MQIHVRFFAAAREAAGCTEEVAELPEASQILDLRRWLLDRHPGLRSVEPQLRYAIEHDFVDLETALVDGALVALIPPVGGG